jgi:cytochrome c-type biogenesis protein CcmE
MNKRVKFVIGGTIIVALLGYLVVSGINSRTMVYYKTVSEVKANSDDLYEKGIRLSGTVVEGSLKKNSKTLDYSFTLSEEGAEIPVRYHGVLPDIFKEGNERFGRITPLKQLMSSPNVLRSTKERNLLEKKLDISLWKILTTRFLLHLGLAVEQRRSSIHEINTTP